MHIHSQYEHMNPKSNTNTSYKLNNYGMMLYIWLVVCTTVPDLAIHTADPNPIPNTNPNHVIVDIL